MVSPSPFDCLPEVEPRLKQLDSIPLTGKAPPFAWNLLSERLSQLFERPDFFIKPGKIEWKTKESLLEGMGDLVFPLSFSVFPLEGHLTWILPLQQKEQLVRWFLTHDASPSLPMDEEAVLNPFYHFFALETLYQTTQIFKDHRLNPLLNEKGSVPQEDALCWDIHLSLGDLPLSGRLLISPAFRKSWVDFFSDCAPSSHQKILNQTRRKTITISLGSTHLSSKQWTSIQVGDLLLIEQHSFHLPSFEGKVSILCEGDPIFEASLKKNRLTISEISLFQEVNNLMPKKPINEDHDDETTDLELSDDDFDFSEDEESLDEEDESFDEESDDDHEIEEDEEEEDQEEESSENVEEEKEASEDLLQNEDEQDVPLASPKEIPFKITVELARIEMPFDSFSQIEPGNLIELHKNIKEEVHLSVNGKIVAKGELVKIGDLLGVRIQEVGR